MRAAAWMLVALPLLAPGAAGAASGAITCAQIPEAQRFIGWRHVKQQPGFSND
ncbi:MAG: hypothetical protein ACLQJR_15595 [Stellaceae bacterium]